MNRDTVQRFEELLLGVEHGRATSCYVCVRFPFSGLPLGSPEPSLFRITASQRVCSSAGDAADAGTSSGRRPRPWPLLVIGFGAAVAVWSGWGLGQLTGFGVVQLLPGLWDDLYVNTAVVLLLSVEAYAGYALRCWLGATDLSPRPAGSPAARRSPA